MISRAGDRDAADGKQPPDGLKRAVLFMHKCLQPNILPLIEQLAQQPADPLEHAAGRPRDLRWRA